MTVDPPKAEMEQYWKSIWEKKVTQHQFSVAGGSTSRIQNSIVITVADVQKRAGQHQGLTRFTPTGSRS